MKKLKIAQVVSLQESVPPKGKNGLEYVVHYLTEELVKRGHKVTLFATKDSKTGAKLVDILPYSAAKKRFLNWNGADYSLSAMAKAAVMADDFDVIHTHIGSAAFCFVDLIKTPIIETVHSQVCKVSKKYLPKEGMASEYIKNEIRKYKKSCHVFVSKNQEKNSFFKNNNFVIHNGIDCKEFRFRKDPEDYFVYLGYITSDKGAHFAVKAARSAKVKLKLAGSYKYCEQYFKEEIRPYLKKGQIEYIGVVNHIQRNRLLGNAKAILFPVEWEEPFGLVMIEAMACGTPVIGFNRAAVSEIVKNNKTGFIVKDYKEMARAIKKINIINRADCRIHIEKNFSVEKMTDEYERVYERAMENFNILKSKNE